MPQLLRGLRRDTGGLSGLAVAQTSHDLRGMVTPALPAPDATIAHDHVAPSAGPTGVRVLVVDDDARFRRVVSTAISRLGFHVFAADDGAPAIKLAQQTPPDLALVDLHMPTSGIEVVRQLKQMFGPSVWVGVLSGADDEETRVTCFSAGADDVLAKPVMLAELKRRVLAAARTQQAYVESRLAQERADRLIAYGAEAAAMLAHDLNNGLAVALSNMTYLHGVVTLGEDETQALTAGINALRRMSGLVANFVDIARFEDAAVKPQVSNVNVRALLHEVMEVHSAIPDRPVSFQVDCDPSRTGYFDVALIERVLHNLIGNATRYCKRGGTIELTARAWHELDDTSCQIRVFNTGPLVPEELRHKLFAKYAKGTNGKRGFGLYFCRLACEAHGGLIDYEPGDSGSAFVIRLPGRG